MAETSIRNQDAIREAMRNVCDKGELLLLVTPYLRLESNFLRLEQNAVHVTALMSREEALFGLRSTDLRMRFPYGHQFYEAPTRALGVGMSRGKQSLSLAVPTIMNMDDYRGAYRVERVGRLRATFSSRKYELLGANVVNLSTSGVRIFAQRDFEDGEVGVDDLIHISLTVTPEIVIHSKVKVRYLKDRILGLEFRPQLDGPLLDELARWVFQKREEELLLHSRRDESEERPAGSPPRTETAPVLKLVASDPDLEVRLKDILKDLPPLERVPPTLQNMKDLAASTRGLVLFHVTSLGMDERKRLKVLAEALCGRTPFLLLGTGVETGALFELGNELKAVSAYALGAGSAGLLPRLLQGILRKHFPGSLST